MSGYDFHYFLLGRHPVCENLGDLSLCKYNQQVCFSYDLISIDKEVLDYSHCELLKNNELLPCSSNNCQFGLQTFNFSCSYSFQCSLCGGNILV